MMKPMKIVMLGIAGNLQDFLLAPSSLAAYLNSFSHIKDGCSIINIDEKLILQKDFQSECLRIAEVINAIGPNILGISAYCWNIDAIKKICEYINERVVVIVGGPEIDREDIESGSYRNDNFTHLVIGEGEIPFKLLVESYINQDLSNIQDIPRLATKNGNQYVFSIHQSPSDGVVSDMDLLPSPYIKEVIDINKFNKDEVTFNIETQRGCNLRCAYCLYHANFPSIKYKNPREVLDEISFIYLHGGKHLRITDANFFSDKNFSISILNGLIERSIQMSIFIEVIPIFIDQQVSELLLEYREVSDRNTITIGLGIQSMNEKSLKAIRRNISVNHFERAFNLLSKGGIIIKTDIILGLPFETKETWLEFIDYLSDKMRYEKNSMQLALLRLLPGTELKEFRKKFNLVEDESVPAGHFVYETPQMRRPEFIDCLRISAMAYRVFHRIHELGSIELRELFFHILDSRKLKSVQLLQLLIDNFTNLIKNRGIESDFCLPDFPNPEHYWEYEIFIELNHEVLRDILLIIGKAK